MCIRFFSFSRPFTSETSPKRIDEQDLGEKGGGWWKRRKGVGTGERQQKRRGAGGGGESKKLKEGMDKTRKKGKSEGRKE